jgi:hypothetical protein
MVQIENALISMHFMDVQTSKNKAVPLQCLRAHKNLQIPSPHFRFNSKKIIFFFGVFMLGLCFEIFKGIGLKLAFL